MATSERTKCDAIRWLLAAAPLIGCTTVLGIDGDYTARDGSPLTASGGSGTGGSGGTGASSTSGGSGGSGALGGSGGQQDAPACPTGQKWCTAPNGNGACVKPQPLFGCSLQDCDHCPAPPMNAVAICNGDTCDLACISGYVVDQVNGSCVPSGSGGTGGSGGSGGSAATGGSGGSSGAGGNVAACTGDAGMCGPCFPVGVIACCRNDGTCGCTYVPGLCW